MNAIAWTLVGLLAAPVTAAPLRVGFGDNQIMPVRLLRAPDLVCTPHDLGLGPNAPSIRMTKFTGTLKMTPEEFAKRKAEGFNWICYDNENGATWPTPKEELADPTRFTILAAQRAHAAGLKFIAEPSFELIVGQGTRIRDGKLDLTDKRVPALDFPRVSPYLDAISLQLQRAQLDLEKYRALTRRYADEIRAANPRTIIFVQVTSRKRGGKESTPEELLESVRATRDLVDGVWIHVDTGQEAYAARLLTLMGNAGFR